MTAVVVLHYGAVELTEQCVRSIGDAGHDCRVVVVDNQGDYPAATVRPGRNVGFAAGCNLGAFDLSDPVLVFVNNDVIVHPGWLPPLEDAIRAGANVAGPRCRYPSGEIQSYGVSVDFSRPAGLEAVNRTDEHPAGREDAVTGACMAVNAETFWRHGGFDEGFWNGYEDVDLCLGVGGVVSVDATVTHLESQSGPERWTGVRRNIWRLREKWDGDA